MPVSNAPLDLGGLEIPLAVAVLLGGTVILVSTLTLIARLIGRLWPPSRDPEGRGGGREGRAGDSRTRRRAVAMPRVVLAATMAACLLFALAWAAFVLGRGTSFA